MGVIRFKQANCKNCYKCIRVCPVKSIRIKDEQAEIIEHTCVNCGSCLKACPQNAKHIRNDLHSVQKLLETGQKVIVSLAPSFLAAFDLDSPYRIVGALKALGFHEVQETAIGADLVSYEYRKLFVQSDIPLISSACPTIVNLIEMYYPEVLPHLAPVVSPLLAHGRQIKSASPHTKIVFIGPCISKKVEIRDYQVMDVIDAALTFEELQQWLDEENINIYTAPELPFDGKTPYNGRFYPAPGGIIQAAFGNEPALRKHCLHIDGLEEAINVIQEIKQGILGHYFIELNSCKGGCMGGPAFPVKRKSFYSGKVRLMEFCKLEDRLPIPSPDLQLTRNFINKSIHTKEPSKQEIQKILEKIGKYSEADYLNCGACGYNSCVEKAKAVLQKKAELYMCVPYMKEKAESLSNIVIENTPNGIIVVDENLQIHQFNPAASKMFLVSSEKACGKFLWEYMDTQYFESVRDTKQNLIDLRISYKNYGIVTTQHIIYLKDHHLIMGMIQNITKAEQQENHLVKLKSETLDMAQKVIEKQMRVAQEIASLLGETTAETKVTLTKLKQIVHDDRA